MSAFQSAKIWLIQLSGLAKDALHIHVALALFLGSALIFGWKLAGWRPWLVVAVAALLGEAWDIRDTLAAGLRLQIAGNIHDLWNTMLWPSAILLLARTTRVLKR